MLSSSKGKQRERLTSISIKSSNHSPPPLAPAARPENFNSHRNPTADSHRPSNPYPRPSYSRQQYSELQRSSQAHPDLRAEMMRGAAMRESSVSSSIAGGSFHPHSSSNPPIHPFRTSNAQDQYQMYPYRTPTPSIVNAGPSGPRYPPSISSRSDIDLIGDGPPVGLVRPPPTDSSDGENLNNIDDDDADGDEEGDGPPPLIFHCKKCGKVIGDTWSWVTARTDMRIVVLATVTEAVSAQEELLTSKDAGPLTGSPYTVIDCSNCDTTLGKIYRMTPKDRDDLRDAYSLNVDALSIYPVGSAKQSVGAIAPDTALRLTPGSFPAPTSAASNEAGGINSNGNIAGSGHPPATFHELSQLRVLVMTMGERLVKLEQVVDSMRMSASKPSLSGPSAMGFNVTTPTRPHGASPSQAQGSIPDAEEVDQSSSSREMRISSNEKPAPSTTKGNLTTQDPPPLAETEAGPRALKSLSGVQASSSETLVSTSADLSSNKSTKRKKTNVEEQTDAKNRPNSKESKRPKRMSRRGDDAPEEEGDEREIEGNAGDDLRAEVQEHEGGDSDDFDADPAEAFEQESKSPQSANKIGEATRKRGKGRVGRAR